ncbi:uncharacterized protein [Montipora foliosa]|uniref:uncharacterized protein isoform X1 n=2 Tax=Montipora TaxID=46703 RepID=UPI0035F185B0
MTVFSLLYCIVFAIFLHFPSNSKTSIIWPLPASISLSGPPLPVSPVFTFKTSSTSGVLKRGITRYLEIILQQIEKKNHLDPRANDEALSELFLIVSSDSESLQADTSYNYTLKLSKGQASIESKTPYGALYGMETFSQLIVDGSIVNSTVNIVDEPKYNHRGLMLDTGRRYFPVELLYNILDGMSYVKLNVFHLHILDWCRFSVESKLYPELQNASSEFYSQEQIRSLVSYAADRGIRVIPEVESAFHVGGLKALDNKTKGLRFCNISGLLQLYDDPEGITVATMKNILIEMMSLFPGKYFHLGLDEVENSSPCTFENTKSLEQELMKFLVQHGKIPFAWQEALTSTSAAIEGTVLQAWTGTVLKSLIDKGFQVIKSMENHLYLSGSLSISALWTDISSGLNPHESAQLLGGEMALWTDAYCFVDQCLLYERGKPQAWWMYGPESDSQFTESASGIIWPKATVGASSFWNYQPDIKPDSQEFLTTLSTLQKRMVQRGVLTCPLGCKCDELTRCGQKYPQP